MSSMSGETVDMGYNERLRFLEIKTVAGSSEPHKLYLKRNGSFLGSFKDTAARDTFILKLSSQALKPAKITRSKQK